MYFYKAKLIRIVDSDTIDAEIDLGFDMTIRQRIRLYGVLTPNSRSNDLQEKELGLATKSKLIELLPREFYVETVLNRRGKYGRVLGTVYYKDQNGEYVNVNQMMIDSGHAKSHSGFTKE